VDGVLVVITALRNALNGRAILDAAEQDDGSVVVHRASSEFHERLTTRARGSGAVSTRCGGQRERDGAAHQRELEDNTRPSSPLAEVLRQVLDARDSVVATVSDHVRSVELASETSPPPMTAHLCTILDIVVLYGIPELANSLPAGNHGSSPR